VTGAWCLITPPDPRATLNKLLVATAGSRDHDSSAPAPVSSRTRRKLMLSHREDEQAVVSAEVHRSDESSDEGEYVQTVAVGGRQGKLDAVSQCIDTAGGVAATVIVIQTFSERYEYMSDRDVFKETSLSPKEAFYSTLKMDDITDDEYKHAQKMWNRYGCQTMEHYTSLYVKLDTVLLADVFAVSTICF